MRSRGLAALSHAWALGQGTLAYYYGAAGRGMSMSWHDFAFGAFDPGAHQQADGYAAGYEIRDRDPAVLRRR